MTLVMMLVVVAVGTFAIYKLLMWSRTTGNKLGNAGALAIALVMLFAVKSLADAPEPSPKHTQATYKPAKVEQVKPVEPTPEEVAERQRQEEEKHAADEERRRQQAAREAERAAKRISIEDFESEFLARNNQFAQAMGIPFEVGLNEPTISGDARTYTLDSSAETKMIVRTASGGVKSVVLNTYCSDVYNLTGSILLYNLILQIITPNVDIDTVYRELSLDDTIVDNLYKARTSEHDGYRFTKSMRDKTLILGVSEK